MTLMQHENLKSKGDARPGCEQGKGHNCVCKVLLHPAVLVGSSYQWGN